MLLKNSWSEVQENIILAAKKQLKREPFEIQIDLAAAIQTVLERKNIPFYEAWDDITADLKGYNNFSMPYWYIVFLQCCISVPTEQKNKQVQLSLIPKEINKLLKKLPCLNNPEKLPERLMDKQLVSAAMLGNLPQIIMLYDMAQNPGQKMKNIYHILLNNQLYEQVIFLHERYGGLEQVNHQILQEHFFFSKKYGKKFFDKFFCQNILPQLPYIWHEAQNYCILDKILTTALEYKVIPKGTIYEIDITVDCIRNQFKLPLITFLHLVDELKEELEALAPWEVSNYKMVDYMNSILEAARIYSDWENEQKEDNHESAK